MSCKRLSGRARREQDYWLSFSDFKAVTEEERMDFLRYDSHGGDAPPERVPRVADPAGVPYCGMNPILLGKKRHGQFGELLRDAYEDRCGGWVGGMEMVLDYTIRDPFGMRPLREWFGEVAPLRWIRAAFPFLNLEAK